MSLFDYGDLIGIATLILGATIFSSIVYGAYKLYKIDKRLKTIRIIR